MNFKNATDYGTAPEICVGEVASVERISPGQVRVSYYNTFRGPDGKPENRIVLHIVWDMVTWLRMEESFAAARALVAADPLGKEAGVAVPESH